MPNINWGSVEAKTDGDFQAIEPGAYVCAIMDAKTDQQAEYVVFEFDVMEGPKAECFKGSLFPPRMWLSWKDGALPMTKGRLETIQADNPGFDAMAAFNNNSDLFKAKKCGVVFRAEEYVDRKTGEVKMGSPKPYRIVPVADVRAGKIAAPKPKLLTDEQIEQRGGHRPEQVTRQASTSSSTAPVDEEDIPF